MKKQPINPALLNAIAAGAALKTQDVSQSVQASPEIACALIDPNPYQPRLDYDPIEVRALADSIEEYGLLQSIVVRRDGDHYTLVAGHTRLEAFKLLGRTTIPANIIDVSDTEMAALALIENVQRAQLHPLEICIAISRPPFDEMKDEEIVKILGYSNVTKVRNIRSISRLSEEVREHMTQHRPKIGVDILVEIQKLPNDIQMSTYLWYCSGDLDRTEIRELVRANHPPQTTKTPELMSRHANTIKIDCNAITDIHKRHEFDQELHTLITKYNKRK